MESESFGGTVVKNLSGFKAIIFDLDDTLVPSTVCYDVALKQIGLRLNERRYQNARNRVKDRVGKLHVSSHNRLLYFKQMWEAPHHINARPILKSMDLYEAALSRAIRSHWKKLRRDRLMSALKRKYRLGILSNETTRTQLLKLSVMDPHNRYFHSLVTSEEMGVEKPDPRMFKEVVLRLGVSPGQCLMIGDNLKTDLIPARRLGMKTILTGEFTPLPKTIPPQNLVIRSLEQLPHILGL